MGGVLEGCNRDVALVSPWDMILHRGIAPGPYGPLQVGP